MATVTEIMLNVKTLNKRGVVKLSNDCLSEFC